MTRLSKDKVTMLRSTNVTHVLPTGAPAAVRRCATEESSCNQSVSSRSAPVPQTATLKAPTSSKAELAEEEVPSAEDKAASEATREEVAVATLSGEAVEEEEEEEEVTILSGATKEVVLEEEQAVATLSGEAVEEEEEEEQAVATLSGATREEVEEEEEPWTHSGRTNGDTVFRTSILRQNRHAIIRGQRIYGTVDTRSSEDKGFTVQSTRDHQRTKDLRYSRHAIIRGQRIYGTVDTRSSEDKGFTVQSTRDHQRTKANILFHVSVPAMPTTLHSSTGL